jgi:hypothetical protein
MSASQAKEMSSIPSIREGEGFISMEDVRLVTSFVKLMVKFCNEKRAAATAAKKCVCVENGIMQQPCFVKLAEIDAAFKLFCNETFDDHDTVYKRIVFGKAMGNLTAIVNHVFEQPMLTNGHVPFFGKSMRSVWFGAKLLGADSALIIARNLPSYSEKKKAAMIAFNANFVNHLHASARVIQVAFKRYKFKLLQLKCAICTRQGRLRAVLRAFKKNCEFKLLLRKFAICTRQGRLRAVLHTFKENCARKKTESNIVVFMRRLLEMSRLRASMRVLKKLKELIKVEQEPPLGFDPTSAMHTAPPQPRASLSMFDIPPPKMQEQWETMNRGKRIPVSPPEMMDFASNISASSAKAPSLLSVNNPYSRLSVASVASVASTDTSASSVSTSVESLKSLKSIKSLKSLKSSSVSLLSSQSLSSTASSGLPPATPSTGGPIVHGGLDPHGKIKLAAIKAALIELEEYADVLKKDNLFCPPIKATTTTEVIIEVADRLMIPFEDNYLLLARLIFQRLVGKLTNSPEVSCETPLQAYRAYKSI